MNLIIHRGTNEIGGTCIELQSGRTRILIDFGMPLVDSKGCSFDFNQYKKLGTAQLVEKGILPDIPGLYGSEAQIDAIIISHPHADHFGLINYLNPEIPIYLGEATYKILSLNNIFLRQNIHIKHPRYFIKEVPFSIGKFEITPYWNDHSAFDSYSFLIGDGVIRLFYSGDFRSHGRRQGAYKWFLNHAPGNIDYLLLEGTHVNNRSEKVKTEEEIQEEFVSLFKTSSSINYVYSSGQNIDRLVSVYKACLKTGKTFVLDVYSANILDALSDYANLPTPLKEYRNLEVIFPHRLTTDLYKRGYGELATKFAVKKTDKKMIAGNPSAFVMMVRPSMKPDLAKLNIKDGNFIFSMWEGYKSQSSTQEFIDWLASNNFKTYDIHTSGHACAETLQELANALNPGTIIPIHTFHKHEYKNIFSQKVMELDDNELLDLKHM